jgi:hypothetical protein
MCVELPDVLGFSVFFLGLLRLLMWAVDKVREK